MDQLLTGLKAAGEPTRFRLLNLLAERELTVTEVTQILGQSQPRVSRHLKLMVEAGLLDRFREGTWAFYRLADDGICADLARSLIGLAPVSDATLTRDRARLDEVIAGRVEIAQDYFRQNAERWDEIRALYVPEDRVEQSISKLTSDLPHGDFLDMGTGTGQILTALAPGFDRAVGIDLAPEMLTIARGRLDDANIANAQVRRADLFALPFDEESFDVITAHQVLHYLDRPAAAIREAARVLRPGGRLIVADFAPHDLDELRDVHAHRRLGFAPEEIQSALTEAGLNTGEVIRLSPPSGKGSKGLTILIWTGDQPESNE